MINDLKKFLNEEQDPKAVEKVLVRINSILTSQEKVEYKKSLQLIFLRTV